MVFTIEKSRIYAKNSSGKIVAEILFPEKTKGVFCIERTFVDDSLRGQGIASRLMRMAVLEITQAGGTVTATCSYAKNWLEQHS